MDVTELHDEERSALPLRYAKNLLVQMQDRWENYGITTIPSSSGNI